MRLPLTGLPSMGVEVKKEKQNSAEPRPKPEDIIVTNQGAWNGRRRKPCDGTLPRSLTLGLQPRPIKTCLPAGQRIKDSCRTRTQRRTERQSQNPESGCAKERFHARGTAGTAGPRVRRRNGRSWRATGRHESSRLRDKALRPLSRIEV